MLPSHVTANSEMLRKLKIVCGHWEKWTCFGRGSALPIVTLRDNSPLHKSHFSHAQLYLATNVTSFL